MYYPVHPQNQLDTVFLPFTICKVELTLASEIKSICFACIIFSSVTQSCPTLCKPMDCSTPGFPIYHQLPELIQTHVHRVSDPIQPSHPLSSYSPTAFNVSQHQGLFQWSQFFTLGGQRIGASASMSVLPMNIQD